MKPPSLKRIAIAIGVLVTTAAGATATAAGSPPNPFTITHRFSARSLGLFDPDGLAIAPNGNLYVTDRHQRVTEISPAGKVLRRWGKRGSGPGQFRFVGTDPNDPNDIHSKLVVGPHGNVYVSDSGNSRIQVFTAKGRFLRQFGSFGGGKNQLLSPDDIAIDRSGDVYVVDTGALKKFSPSGKAVWTSRFAGHLSMIDSHGRLLITNDDTGQVFYVDENGRQVDRFGAPSDFPSSACDATSDAAGYTYVNGCGTTGSDGKCCAATEVFDAAHTRVGEWLGSPLADSPRFGPHGEIFALAWQPGYHDATSPSYRGNVGLLRLAITHPGG